MSSNGTFSTWARGVIRVVHAGPLLALLGLAIAFAGFTAVGFAQGATAPGAAIFRSAALGSLAARTETFLPHVIFLWAIVGATLTHAVRVFGPSGLQSPIEESEQNLQRWFIRFGLVACLGVFLFSLMRSWAGTAPEFDGYVENGTTRYASLFGVLPWSDAHGYYDGARHLLDTGRLDFWSERRPMNAALLALRLGLTGFDLHVATLLQTLLVAFSTYLAARALARRLGVWAGLGTAALILAFVKVYQPTTLSETLGVSLGALSFSLLYRGVDERNGYFAAAGLGALSLGMSARAGALLAIPCLFLALFLGARVVGPAWKKAAAVALLLGLLGFSWTSILNRTYGTGAGMAGANFSYTVAGLAIGGSWSDAQAKYMAELTKLPTEREQANFLYARTLELIARDPRPFLQSLWLNETAFTSDIVPFVDRLALFNVPALINVQIALLGAGILWYLVRRPPDLALWLGSWAGLLLSIPLIFGDGRWRALATSWPFVAAFLSTGLATAKSPSSVIPPVSRSMFRDPAWITAVVLALAAWGGPWVVHAAYRRPAVRCVPLDKVNTLVIARSPLVEPVVTVVEPGRVMNAGVPEYEVSSYIDMVRESNMEDRRTLSDPPPAPFVVLWSYDYVAHKNRQLIAPADVLSVRSPWVWLKIEQWKGSPYFMYVTDFGTWEACQARPAVR